MFVCMDVGVAAAYVCFVMDGIMFVCMDVGVAAGGHPRISQGEGVLSKRLKHTKYELPPLGRVRGGASPPAYAVIATKAEPSEDAIGFLYLFLSCPIP